MWLESQQTKQKKNSKILYLWNIYFSIWNIKFTQYFSPGLDNRKESRFCDFLINNSSSSVSVMASLLSGFILFLFVISVGAENTKQILPEAVVTARTDYNVAVFYRMLTQKVSFFLFMS